MGYKYTLILEVISPILASMSEDYNDFRVFRKGRFDVVLYKNNEELNKKEIDRTKEQGWLKADPPDNYDYKTLKEYLLKQRFSKVTFIFPRVYSDPHKISYIKIFSNPVFYMLKKLYNINPRIVSYLPKQMNLGLYMSYTSKTRTPLVYETFEEGSQIEIAFLSDKKLDKKDVRTPKYAQMGFRRNRGFGIVKLTIIENV